MNNLIDEIENKIEELKNELGDLEYDRETRIEIETYKYILSILNQYNIITAPKEIKLSEIVSRLNECDKRNKFKAIIQVGETTVVENTEFKKEYFYIKNNKIFDLSDYMVRDEYKFLYALWIADTIIVDDLKEEE